MSVARLWVVYSYLLLTAGLDRVARVYKSGKAYYIRSYFGDSKDIYDAVFSPDNKSCLAAGHYPAILLLNMKAGHVTEGFTTSSFSYCVCFSSSEKWTKILNGCGDKKVLQVDIHDTSGVFQKYDHHTGAANTFAFVDDDRRLASRSKWQGTATVEVRRPCYHQTRPKPDCQLCASHPASFQL